MGNLPPELVRNSQGQRMSAWNQQGRPDLYSQSSFPPPPPGGAGGIPQQPPFRYPLSEYLPQGTALFIFSNYSFFNLSPAHYIFVKATKIPKIDCEIFISMCFVFACLASLS